jgi:hypothetical protein
MSVVIDKLAERQDQFIDLMVQWQKPVVAGLRRTAALMEGQAARLEKLPNVSDLPGLSRLGRLPGADRLANVSLPSPEEVVRNQFAFAERLLETNKQFAMSLATLAERPAKPAASKSKSESGEAPKRPAAAAKPRRTATRATTRTTTRSTAKPAARRTSTRRSPAA